MEGTEFFDKSVNQTIKLLQSGQAGLTKADAQTRLEKYGPNTLTPPPPPSALKIYLSQFKNSLIIILLLAALLTAIVWYFTGERTDLIEASLIIGIVLLITGFGFFQEYKAEQALEEIRSLLSYEAKVIRSGQRAVIPTAQLVPGDLIILEEGDKVPADGRIIESADLHINEAILTGESNPVSKIIEAISGKKLLSERMNMAFSGTVVSRGRGKAIVVATGNSTQVGQIANLVSTTPEGKTPIQKRLDEISRLIGFVVMIIAVVLFAYSFFFVPSDGTILRRLLEAAIAAVALGVAAVPEGLPAVVTISMAFGTQKMLKRQVLVRKLNSVETLGSVDVICSDKTGTLTSGEMTVTKIWTLSGYYDVTGVGFLAEGLIKNDQNQTTEDPLVAKILLCGAVCNNASLEPKPIGDPTELALLVSAKKGHVGNQLTRLKEVPFSSERKRMSVLVSEGQSQTIYAKGAPEIILERCDEIVDGNKVRLLSSADRQKILAQNSQLASQALRVLAFAYKKSGAKNISEDQLIFLGLQGMIDPPRPEIAPTLQLCRESGVKVVMITGDNPETAKAIARTIGLGERCLTGAELDKTTDDQFDELVEVTSLYARVSPDFKMRIIESLKRKGHIVAMTGDGVNDAPALKKADIGVAMGKSGTDVAKEASDMVLLDDNFANIVAAIIEGRGIFHNIRKFVSYLISCNIAEVLIVLIGAIIFKDVVLTAVMLLWINVITDGLPAIALGLDSAEKDVIKRSPREFQREIISSKDWLGMVGFSLVISLATLFIYYLTSPAGEVAARTAAFTALVIFELARIFIIRFHYRTPVLSNPLLIFAVIVSLLLQLAIVYLEPLRGIFELEVLAIGQWYPIIVATALLLAWPLLSSTLGKRPVLR